LIFFGDCSDVDFDVICVLDDLRYDLRENLVEVFSMMM
jgi:hypothetical protein